VASTAERSFPRCQAGNPHCVAHGQVMKRQSVENPSQMRRVPEYTDEASDEELAGTF